MMVLISANTNEKIFVDDDIYKEISKYRWYVDKNGYVARSFHELGKKKCVYLHRQILNAISGDLIDHIDCNKLNNLKNNLRYSDKSSNACNRGKQINNTSGYKGVTWNKQRCKWQAQICINKKRIHIGLYFDVIEAAKAYNEAAIKYHGEFAKLNEI